jgi:hypothetical protein
MDHPTENSRGVQSILKEFTGLDTIVSHLGKIDSKEVENVSPETLTGYVAFGALMCYTTTQDSTAGEGAAELANAWDRIANTLGVGARSEAPTASAG